MDSDLIYDPHALKRLLTAVRRWRSLLALPEECMDALRFDEMVAREAEMADAIDFLDATAVCVPAGVATHHVATERITVN